jgi:hypothetical protein
MCQLQLSVVPQEMLCISSSCRSRKAPPASVVLLLVAQVMARCQGQPPSPLEAETAAAEDAAAGNHSAAAAAAVKAAGMSAAAAAVKADGGTISAFLVDRGPGVTFGLPEKKMGWRSQPTGTVHFDRVFVPHDNMLGQHGGGFKIAMHALDGGRINIAACSVGGAQFCLDYSWKYTSERHQVRSLTGGPHQP